MPGKEILKLIKDILNHLNIYYIIVVFVFVLRFKIFVLVFTIKSGKHKKLNIGSMGVQSRTHNLNQFALIIVRSNSIKTHGKEEPNTYVYF